MPNEALRQLLYYMEDTRYENALNEDLREIHRMVETVKKEPGTMLAYIRFQERMKKSRAEGDLYRLISLICKKLKKNKTLEEIAADLEEEASAIEPIYSIAKECAPEYDPDQVFERMNTAE